MNEEQLDKINDLTNNCILSIVMDYIGGRSNANKLMDDISERCEQAFITGRDAQRESDANIVKNNSSDGHGYFPYIEELIRNNTGDL